MKRVLLILILVLLLILATGTPATALTIGLPNGNTVDGLPDQAVNAAKSGKIVIYATCPLCGGNHAFLLALGYERKKVEG